MTRALIVRTCGALTLVSALAAVALLREFVVAPSRYRDVTASVTSVARHTTLVRDGATATFELALAHPSADGSACTTTKLVRLYDERDAVAYAALLGADDVRVTCRCGVEARCDCDCSVNPNDDGVLLLISGCFAVACATMCAFSTYAFCGHDEKQATPKPASRRARSNSV